MHQNMSKRTSNGPEGKRYKNTSHSKIMGADMEKTDEMSAETSFEKNIKPESQEDQDADADSIEQEGEVQLVKKLEKAEQDSREWYDKYLRLSAEFDNYRKRTLKEKADMMRFANEDLLKDLLPIIDDFERGMDNIEKASDIEALKAGVILIYNKFREFIKQNGLKEIEARDQVFNLDFHEAITAVPSPSEDMKGKVLDVIEKGYLLNDKVIRYAKVILGE
jgi:molecular chaperone GrpE